MKQIVSSSYFFSKYNPCELETPGSYRQTRNDMKNNSDSSPDIQTLLLSDVVFNLPAYTTHTMVLFYVCLCASSCLTTPQHCVVLCRRLIRQPVFKTQPQTAVVKHVSAWAMVLTHLASFEGLAEMHTFKQSN